MIIGCEMPQCIHNRNKRDTAQQVLHGKHTLSLITAVSTGYGKREALCLFFVFWTELQRAGGGGGWLWNGCTSREAVYTGREGKQKETHDFPRRRRHNLEISSSHIAKAGKATVADCGIFSLALMIYDVHTMAAREHARQSFCLE